MQRSRLESLRVVVQQNEDRASRLARNLLIVVVGRRVISAFAFMHFAMPSEVGNHGKVASTALDLTGKCYCAC